MDAFTPSPASVGFNLTFTMVDIVNAEHVGEVDTALTIVLDVLGWAPGPIGIIANCVATGIDAGQIVREGVYYATPERIPLMTHPETE